eukprot:TRINITY_DN1182_c0_g2_i2.p1 TRINITY_DN1182_c0_g2~~TRINITY_DN1182_c0_g2_i2.p1  ORF type:complete len:368 (-),score=74.21 TRINITY_DN1182_c0_g2_i2:107-1066(-)
MGCSPLPDLSTFRFAEVVSVTGELGRGATSNVYKCSVRVPMRVATSYTAAAPVASDTSLSIAAAPAAAQAAAPSIAASATTAGSLQLCDAVLKHCHSSIFDLQNEIAVLRGIYHIFEDRLPLPTLLDIGENGRAIIMAPVLSSLDYVLFAAANKQVLGAGLARIVNALQEVHSKVQVVHYDIRPPNILCDPNDPVRRLYLVDWGFAVKPGRNRAPRNLVFHSEHVLKQLMKNQEGLPDNTDFIEYDYADDLVSLAHVAIALVNPTVMISFPFGKKHSPQNCLLRWRDAISSNPCHITLVSHATRTDYTAMTNAFLSGNF